MTPAHPGSGSIPRIESWGVALTGAALVGSLAYLVHPWYEPRNDAAMYIATARSLVAGDGYRFLDMPFVVRPPGFSLLIAPVLGIVGTNFFALNLLVSAIGLLGIALLYLLLRDRLGWVLALAVGLSLWLNPGYQNLCNSVMSDVPGATSLLGCLLLDRWCTRRPSWRRECVLGLGIALSAYLRTPNLVLIPAIALARIAREWSRRGDGVWAGFFARRLAIFSGIAGLLVLPWFVYASLHVAEPPVDQTRLHSYTTAMFHRDPGDPQSPRLGAGAIAARIPLRAHQIVEVLGSRMQTQIKSARGRPWAESEPDAETADPGRGSGIDAGLGVLLLLALAVQAWRRPAAAAGELFAIATVLLLLVYFGFQDRLVLPVYIIALPAAAASLRDGVGRGFGLRAGNAVALAALVLLTAVDFSPRAGWPEIERHHRELAGIFDDLADQLPPDARIAALKGFQHNVFLERPVYSLYRAIQRQGPRNGSEALIERYGLDTVVLAFPHPLRAGLEAHLRDRYGEPRVAGRALIWRVRSP